MRMKNMIIISNCKGCYQCTRTLPEVFKEKWGSIIIDQEKAIDYPKEVIEAICKNIKVEE
jgi:ferredoxin